MDVLTQLDTEIDMLLKIMSSSVAFISRKAKHVPLPESTIPLSILGKTEAIEPDEMHDAIGELVADLVDKADSIRHIIRHLPTEASLGDEAQLRTQLDACRAEMRVANAEYRHAVDEAKQLSDEVAALLAVLADKQKSSRAWLAQQLDPNTSLQPQES